MRPLGGSDHRENGGGLLLGLTAGTLALKLGPEQTLSTG